MSVDQLHVQLIACLVAVACALPGVFLVLRRMAMMSDAISHVILLGIVLAFFVTKDLGSPLLIVAAAGTGVVTVALVELLHRTRLVREDAAIGLAFPMLFSIGIILVSRYAGDIHIDTDAVLVGELGLAHLNRLVVGGRDLGPKALYLMGGILLLNVAFIVVFYKELKLATFDAGLAAALGLSPVIIHYVLMGLVSVTAVGAFDAVGAILVVALMIAPPAAAYLLTDRLPLMLLLSAGIGVVSALSGYWIAVGLRDVPIAGCMATMTGVCFAFTFLFAPERGLVAIARRRARQRWEFADTMLAVHLLNHEGLPEAEVESRIEHLHERLRWAPDFAARVVRHASRRGLITPRDAHLELTDAGRDLARQAMVL